MWRGMLLLGLLLLMACAEVPGRRATPVLGAPPQLVLIGLASGIRYRPYTPEELANPAVQSYVAQCERAGRAHCREDELPADSRTAFVRKQDSQVFIFVKMHGLTPDADYEVRFRLFDPHGGLCGRITATYHMHPAFSADQSFTVSSKWVWRDPAAWELGRWRVEIAVNGRVEGDRTFEVIDRP